MGLIAASAMPRPQGMTRLRMLAVTAVLAALMLVGAKAYFVVEQLVQFGASAVSWSGGYRQPGAIVAALALPLVVRIMAPGARPAEVADVFVVPAALGIATFRVGCLLRGCCFGDISTLPWAVRFHAETPVWAFQEGSRILAGYEPLTVPVHPLQVYFLVWVVASALFAVACKASLPMKPGQTLLLFIAIHEIGKGLIEAFRPAPLVGIDTVRWAHAAIAAAAMGGMVALYWWDERRALPSRSEHSISKA